MRRSVRHERLLLGSSVAALDYILMLLVMYVSYGQQTRLVVWGRTTVVDSLVERKERKILPLYNLHHVFASLQDTLIYILVTQSGTQRSGHFTLI
jgi:hypothetical protein